MQARYLYSELATAIQARKNCETSNNEQWVRIWNDRIGDIMRNWMPNGSGIDSGTKIDLDASHAERLVFTCGYHHMNQDGYYDGWTQHTITVTPSFDGINIRISGRNRNDIKDILYETFDWALSRKVIWSTERTAYVEVKEAL